MKLSELKVNKRNAAAFGVTLLVSAVPALFINSGYGYIPFTAMLISLFLSAGYVLIVRRHLYAKGDSDTIQCRRGEKASFSVCVGNRSLLPVPLATVVFYRYSPYFDQEEIEETQLSILPKSEKTFHFGVLFEHVGVFQTGVKSLRVSDFFGIIHVVYRADAVMDVCVSPNPERAMRIHPAENASAESMRSTAPSLRESMDYAGVREYRFGDPIKNIHWKLSAHTRDYLTKQHEAYSNPGTTIFTDFRFSQEDPERRMGSIDMITETAAAAAYDCFSRGIDYEIQYKGIRGGYQKFIPERFDYYPGWVSNIPFTQPHEGEKAEKIFRVQSLRMSYSYSNIIFCTAEAEESLIDALAGLKKAGRQVLLILAVPDDVYDEDYSRVIAPLKKLDAVKAEYRIVRFSRFIPEERAS